MIEVSISEHHLQQAGPPTIVSPRFDRPQHSYGVDNLLPIWSSYSASSHCKLPWRRHRLYHESPPSDLIPPRSNCEFFPEHPSTRRVFTRFSDTGSSALAQDSLDQPRSPTVFCRTRPASHAVVSRHPCRHCCPKELILPTILPGMRASRNRLP